MSARLGQVGLSTNSGRERLTPHLCDVTFLGGAGAPSTFYFWTIDGNLTGFAPVSFTSTAPEPAGLLLLASGLAGIALLRRRTVQS